MQTLEWLTANLYYLAIPYFLLFIAYEYRVLRGARGGHYKGYLLKDSATSISMGVLNLLMRALFAVVSIAVFFKAYEYRIWDLSPFVWWTWPLLWLAEDFTFYWFHRCSHRVRLLWADHVNHHSSEHYNLSTALRQPVLEMAWTWSFWLPLALIGFHPVAIFLVSGINLLYQFWIHTESVRSLGPLEAVLNTPSHHRVHHGSNPEYIDKNYGGWLIVWDKLFGSFQRERSDVQVRYGLVKDIHTFNLWRVVTHEWSYMLRQAWRAKGLRQTLAWIFGPPEYGEAASLPAAKAPQQDAAATNAAASTR